MARRNGSTSAVLLPSGKRLRNTEARRYVYDLHGGRCFYCGVPTHLSDARPSRAWLATIDHLIPRSMGGSRSDPANLVLACNLCNVMRGRSDPEQFRAFWAAVCGPFQWVAFTTNQRSRFYRRRDGPRVKLSEMRMSQRGAWREAHDALRAGHSP